MLSTKLQSTYDIQSAQVDAAGDIFVVDLSDRPFALGVLAVFMRLHDVVCDAAITVTVRGNDAVDGSGTDYTVGTKTWAAGTVDGNIELDSTMISYATDNKNIKSLVFEVSGGGTITAGGNATLLVEVADRSYGIVNPETATA